MLFYAWIMNLFKQKNKNEMQLTQTMTRTHGISEQKSFLINFGIFCGIWIHKVVLMFWERVKNYSKKKSENDSFKSFVVKYTNRHNYSAFF